MTRAFKLLNIRHRVVQLFDFDLEVQPILEVLVGKTTEQALAEVAQEEELATLREQQRRYVELRDAERAERQRLAAQDLRLHQEKVLPKYKNSATSFIQNMHLIIKIYFQYYIIYI